MRVTLSEVAKGRRGEVLAPVSSVLETGRVTVLAADTDQGPSVLSLILAGRMRPSSGEIHADGGHSRRRLRRATALIDTPAVCEPAPTVALRTVVAEELLFARRRSDPIAVRRWLEEHGLAELGDRSMMHVPAMTRLRALVELALLRPGIEAVVLTSPERFGADVGELVALASEVAARGYAVAIVAGDTAARLAAEELALRGATPAAPDDQPPVPAAPEPAPAASSASADPAPRRSPFDEPAPKADAPRDR